jgi:hypothetical protein
MGRAQEDVQHRLFACGKLSRFEGDIIIWNR